MSAKSILRNLKNMDKRVGHEIFSKMGLNLRMVQREVSSWALTCGDEIRREKQTRHQQRDKAFILLQQIRYDFSKSG